MEDEVISKVSAYGKTRASKNDGKFKKNNFEFLAKK